MYGVFGGNGFGGLGPQPALRSVGVMCRTDELFQSHTGLGVSFPVTCLD